MRARVVGVHRVKRRLANGDVRIHHYAWRGGPKIEAAPDTPEFLAEYLRLTKHKPQGAEDGTIGGLVAQYRADPEFAKLTPSTKRSYEPILQTIVQEYGDMPVALAEERGARADFLQWRSSMADRPRTADLHIAVLKRLLSYAVDREIIRVNKLAGVKPLATGTRREKVWTDEQIASLLAAASPEIALAVRLALDTGQRQGDLLRLPWPAYKDGVIRFRQSKSGANVAFKLSEDVAASLDALPRNTITILCNSRGRPWTSDGFRASWGTTLSRAGIDGLTFHDLRGSFITRKYAAGWSIKQISEVSGHAEKQAEAIIRKHYLAVDLQTGTGTEL
jgi:integrase